MKILILHKLKLLWKRFRKKGIIQMMKTNKKDFYFWRILMISKEILSYFNQNNQKFNNNYLVLLDVSTKFKWV